MKTKRSLQQNSLKMCCFALESSGLTKVFMVFQAFIGQCQYIGLTPSHETKVCPNVTSNRANLDLMKPCDLQHTESR